MKAKRVKIGRNDPCTCGSGKKFKKCCLEKKLTENAKRSPTPEEWQKIRAHIAEKQRAQAEWIARYGHVRPVIHTDNWNKKFVAIGSKLHYSEKWTFVPDFLFDYVPHVFGKDWFDEQVAKDEGERHQVFQWRTGCIRHWQTAIDGGDRWEVQPDGMSAAYLSFAFNLFAIEDNSRLDDVLLQRLKHPAQFQGALHEVFAAACCLRAGFTIENEDERDPATRHTEFTATHKATGERFSVEAKSKHRPGVLGQPGIAQPYEKLRLTYGRLINDAAAKNAKYPLVIFLDTNLPFRSAHHVYGKYNDPNAVPPYIRELSNRIRKEHGGNHPYVMMVMTNIPHHYVAAHEPDPPKQYHAMMTAHPASNTGIALSALSAAVTLYGNIPNEFPVF